MSSGVVVPYFSPTNDPIYDHEVSTITAVARAIAEVKEFDFSNRYPGTARPPAETYFVPDDTLMVDEAGRLGIGGPGSFFGGVVPHRFVRTKAITHELVDQRAERPTGWSCQFGERVRGAVLPGYTVFCRRDALTAAMRLLPLGSIRVKSPLAARGCGQTVMTSIAQLEDCLDQICMDELSASGLVIETNLRQMKTLSVGHIAVNGMPVTYYGTQRIAPDNSGTHVYAGSDLVLVRGGGRALDELPTPKEIRLGVAQARIYEAAMSEYPGFFASRFNYDVGQGMDDSGHWRSGVLEASWRVGGSSPAEITALAAMKREPALRVVSASSVKHFGKCCDPPAAATVLFQGYDPVEGPITRYTIVTRRLRTNGHSLTD